MSARVLAFLICLSIVSSVPFFPVSAKSNLLPATITGTWLSSQIITIRFEDEAGKEMFVSDTVLIRISIDANGILTGTCGRATFSGGRIRENRNWFGNLFNLGTDYVFEGQLTRKIFDTDPLPEKEIKMPFSLLEGYLQGTLLQKAGWGGHPMVEFKLGKR